MSKTFISYSHDSFEHKNNVLVLSDKLRELGIDASLDQYETNPIEGWPRWMAKEIRESTKILLICSECITKKTNNKLPIEVGKGGKFESHLILDQFYQDGSYNHKILPILIKNEADSFIPEFLRSNTHYNISNFDKLESDEGFFLFTEL